MLELDELSTGSAASLGSTRKELVDARVEGRHKHMIRALVGYIRWTMTIMGCSVV